MASPRESISSARSRNSTAVDPQSARPSPSFSNKWESEQCAAASADSDPREDTPSSNTSSLPSLLGRCDPEDRTGWPLLAELMSKVPEFAAFPRFRDLNVKSLLYYQAQLGSLREKLLQQEDEVNLKSDLERYDKLATNANSQYHQSMMELRGLLKEYNEAVLQYSQISALPDPEAYNMRTLLSWITHLKGAEYSVRDRFGLVKTWGDPDEEELRQTAWSRFWVVLGALLWAKPTARLEVDLVVTQPESKIDGLTRWAVYYLIPFYWSFGSESAFLNMFCPPAEDQEKSSTSTQHDLEAQNNSTSKKGKPDAHKTLKSASEATALRFTSAISTVVACLIPVVAIAALTQLHETRDLLLCITGFAVLFAVGLMFLTQGTSSRTEIFAATAAFSAVMVVFISQPIIQMPLGSEAPSSSM